MPSVLLRAVALSFVAGVVTLGAGAADSRSAPSLPAALVVDGSVRIEALFRTPTKGTFRITGAVSDAGALTATRRVAGGRLQLTEVLIGTAGALRIRVARPCAAGRGTWRVLSGTNAYAGLTGGGATSGGPRCVAQKYPTSARYTGAVRTPPPPPLAQPGRFGGGTSQRQEVRLDVLEGGRAFSALRLLVTTPCEGTSITSSVFISLPGPFDIAPDGSFSLQLPPTYKGGSVTGRFTSLTTAEGAASAKTTVTTSANNTTYNCSADVTWKASLPPPAATPGRYCGFTTQGSSICLDVAENGRAVARLEVGVVVLCNGRTTELEVTVVFTDMAIGGNLGFGKSSSSFEGLISGTGFVSGLLDPDGGTGAHGSVRLQLPVLDYEGQRYTCGVGTAQWEARR